MHIVFFGAGGIGGYFGARLLAAGADVSFVARGAHAQAMRESGLRLRSPLGDLQVQVPSVSESPQALRPADVIVFGVKMFDAESAAGQLAPLMQAGSVVLPLQNGVDIVDLLTARLGAAAVALGAAYIPTRIAEPGVIEHLGRLAQLRIGALQESQQPVLERFAAACRQATIDIDRVDDIRTVMWEKFVMLVGMSSLTALTRASIGVVRRQPETRTLLREVMEETAAVAAAEGHPLAADFVDRQMALLDSLPAAAKASMANDLEAGRRLELPWLAGAVLRRGARLGVATPASRFVVAALAPYADGAPPAA